MSINRFFPSDFLPPQRDFEFGWGLEDEAPLGDPPMDLDWSVSVWGSLPLAPQEPALETSSSVVAPFPDSTGLAQRRRVGFQDGVEEPPRSAEGIADRKQVRRSQVQRERHQELVSTFERVAQANWGELERRTAQVCIAAALGLNQWPLVGGLLKWHPFQKKGGEERQEESLFELHREIGAELESLLVMVQQPKVRHARWSFDAERQGPWVEMLQPWEGIDGCIEGLLGMAKQLDQKRAEAGYADALPSLAESCLLILAQQKADLGLTEGLRVWIEHADLIDRRGPHPLLARTVSAWHRAAVREEMDGWSQFWLDVLRGDPDNQEHVFTLTDGHIELFTPQEARDQGLAHCGAVCAALTGVHQADPQLVQAAIAEMVSYPLSRDVSLEDLADRFWETMEILDGPALAQAMEELAAEDPRFLAKIGRKCLTRLPADSPGLGSRVMQALVRAVMDRQLNRVALSRLTPDQLAWFRNGFERLAAAIRCKPEILPSFLEFLHRHQWELESLADRALCAENALDMRLEFYAMEAAQSGHAEDSCPQGNLELDRLLAEWMVAWPSSEFHCGSPSDFSSLPSQAEALQSRALRRAQWILSLEREAIGAAPGQGLSDRLQGLQGGGALTHAEKASLYMFAIRRIPATVYPRKLVAALQAALPLTKESPSLAYQILLGEDWAGIASGRQMQKLRDQMQKSVLKMMTKRQTDIWAQRALADPWAPDLQLCIDLIQVVQELFPLTLPPELQLRVGRLMGMAGIATRVSGP